MQSSGVASGPGPSGGGPGPMGGPSRGSVGADDGDNRSRNAKAQRRHREKRKAHFKALEESVQILNAQLDDARRQLAAAQYASNARLGYSPEQKDVAQLMAENAYLRDENTDLRRQLYAVRNYPAREPGSAGPLPPPPAEQQKATTGIWTEVKTEGSGSGPYGGGGGGGVYSTPSSAVVSSPRIGSSSHGRTMSHPGDFVRGPPTDPGSAQSSSSYPAPLYQFGSVVGDDKWGPDPARHAQPRVSSSSSSRGRLMSSSSAPSASPYVTSAPFPTDPRAHALTPTQPYMVRYESAVYPPAPPPHNLPRSAVGSGASSSGGYAHATTPVQPYVPRAEGEVAWGQDPSSSAAPPTGQPTHHHPGAPGHPPPLPQHPTQAHSHPPPPHHPHPGSSYPAPQEHGHHSYPAAYAGEQPQTLHE